MRNFFTLKEFLKEHKWRYILGIIWVIAVDSLQLVTPKILGWLTDALKDGTIGIRDLWKYAMAVIVVAAGVGFFRYLWRVYISGTARKLEYYLHKRIYNHLLTLSPSFFDNHKTGDLMARVTNDVEAIKDAFGMGVVMFIDSIFLTTLTLAIMVLTIDARLTLVSLAPFPVMIIFVTIFGRQIHVRFLKVQEAFSGLTEKAQENLSGIRVVKSFVQEPYEIEAFWKASKHSMDRSMELVRIQGALFPLIQFLSSLSLVIALVYGGILVINGGISLGDFVAFNSYLATIVWPVSAVGWVINALQRGSASMARINEVLEQEPDIVDVGFVQEQADSVKDATDAGTIPGAIEFRQVFFDYTHEASRGLKDVSFSIEAGETLGIIGRTGSGKSTIVRLLLRLYEFNSGEILIDGRDIRQIPLGMLREEIGYVPQDGFLFSTTIRDNITFGKMDAREQEIIAAAEKSRVWEDISGFPEGLDTVVGERGITLSGGQAQRIAIARALVKDPTLLVLDDSLSAVDADTEREILGNLRASRLGRSNLIISHRVSAVQDADLIVVMDKGQIIERGTHEELLEREGFYQSLHEQQLLQQQLA